MARDDDIREALKSVPAGLPSPEASSSQGGRLSHALSAGKWGALGGAGLGALRSLMTRDPADRSYLRDTLAGALLGAAGAGGTSYLAGADPFTRGAPPAKAFEAGKAHLMESMLDPSRSPGRLAGESIMTGLSEYLSGKHEFGPAQQKALVQQFVKARVPTSQGWRNRINLADKAIADLQANPAAALPALVTLQKVAPDAEMRAYVTEAIARIRGGRAADPEGANALAALARVMEGKTEAYRKATGAIDSMNIMKEMYGARQLSSEDVAKNVGLITGRFGAQTPSAGALRGLIQESLARPVSRATPSPYKRTRAMKPELASLLARAMR